MEERETIEYKVEITKSANRYFFELGDYLYENLSLPRAEEVVELVLEKALSLSTLFFRGSNEPILLARSQGYKYLLVERSKRKYVKIIY